MRHLIRLWLLVFLVQACSSLTCGDGDPQASIETALALVVAADEIPAERQKVTLPGGAVVFSVSREAGLKAYAAEREDALKRVAGELGVMEHRAGRWADDAAVVRGILYASTGGGWNWAPEDTAPHFRQLIARPVPIDLEPWTRAQLLRLPFFLYLFQSDPKLAGRSEQQRLADYFARQLINYSTVIDGPQSAQEELAALDQAGYLPPHTTRELSLMIELYKQRQARQQAERN